MTPISPTEALSTANRILRVWLTRLRPECTRELVIQTEELSELCQLLRRADEALKDLSPGQENPELENQASEYRYKLKELHQFLPRMQRSLLAEKARLQFALNQATCAAAWAEARKALLTSR